MSDRFSEQDWSMVRERLNDVAAQFKSLGATVWPAELFPPVAEAQIKEFEASTTLSLPQDFADLVTRFAGGWKFYWCLARPKSDDWLKPPVFMGNFGGNGEVPFIGATASDTLLSLYRELQAEVTESIDDPESQAIVRASFPLHLFDGRGGDYTVLRLDTDPTEVLFLDHEAGWEVREDHVIGRGFRNFLLRWAEIGFPQTEYYNSWLDEEARLPDNASEKAETWLAWLRYGA